MVPRTTEAVNTAVYSAGNATAVYCWNVIVPVLVGVAPPATVAIPGTVTPPASVPTTKQGIAVDVTLLRDAGMPVIDKAVPVLLTVAAGIYRVARPSFATL